MRAVLDAGFLVALWNAKDEHHAWAVAQLKTHLGPYYVTEMILAEVCHLTGRDREVYELVRTGRLLIAASLAQDAEAVARPLAAYPHCDLADATVVAASEKYPRLRVLTTDRRHFVTYRRSDGTEVPALFPPR